MTAKPRATKKTKIKIPTPQRLRNIALHYLSRYAASENALRRVLQNRIMRASYKDPAFAADQARQEQLRSEIETIIETHRKTGALNDKAYAEMKVNSLRRSGRSNLAITQKLKIKGVSSDIIAKSLVPETEENDPSALDLKAAHVLAKRKRLGPYRKGDTDFERHKKDIAILARAGFPLGIIRKVLDVKTEDLDSPEFQDAFGGF